MRRPRQGAAAACSPTVRQADHPAAGNVLALSVLKAVFSINGERIDARKQPALGLSQVQRNGSRLATGGQKLPDIVHMSARLVFRRKMFQRDERGRQCLGDDPFVVACDSFFWHELTPAVV